MGNLISGPFSIVERRSENDHMSMTIPLWIV